MIAETEADTIIYEAQELHFQMGITLEKTDIPEIRGMFYLWTPQKRIEGYCTITRKKTINATLQVSLSSTSCSTFSPEPSINQANKMCFALPSDTEKEKLKLCNHALSKICEDKAVKI